MYVLVVFLPLFSAFTVGFFGRFFGWLGSAYLTCINMGITFMLSLFIFYEVGLCGVWSNIKFFDWFNVGVFLNSWGFLFDPVTVTMLLVVTSISFLVHIYSVNYMQEDPHLIWFMSYLSLFTFFMLALVTADNFIQLFLGWEGVGLASYLLINFWYTWIQANKAALKAIIVNRLGDFGLTLAILCVFFLFRSFDFTVVFAMVPFMLDYNVYFFGYSLNCISFIAFFLFLGAVGKSAQLGLHTWLPDAMEGPTPVSALIHAATMVTAGVFVLIWTSPLLEFSSEVLLIIVIFGALTAFFAGTVGMVQNDLKWVIAYSTCSQLGYMVFVCGLSNYSVGMFHLMNHAFFKALLFLSAGSVIHALMDEQDMRRMGGLLKLMPYTYVMFLIGSFALMGFPFTTGFYSKDLILEIASVNYYVSGYFSYLLGILAAFCTAFYSFRLLALTFLNETNSYKSVVKHVHDAPLLMGLPLFFLALGSIFVGYLFKDMFVGLGTHFWGNSIFLNSFVRDVLILESEYISSFWKNVPFIVSMFGASLALFLYLYRGSWLYLVKHNVYLKSIYVFLSKKWWFDHIYNSFIVSKVLSFGYNVAFKQIDRGIIELIGPTGFVRLLMKLTALFSKMHSGYIYHYVFVMILSVVFFVLFWGLGSSVVYDYIMSTPIVLLLLILFFVYIIVNFIITSKDLVKKYRV